jgi:hypothetical protein
VVKKLKLDTDTKKTVNTYLDAEKGRDTPYLG